MSYAPIIITMGDVNGIGPEIIAKALAQPELRAKHHLVIVGDADVYEEARRFAPGAPRAQRVDAVHAAQYRDDQIAFFDADVPAPSLHPGEIDAKAGAAAAAWIEAAAKIVMSGDASAMVTCPIHKEGLYRAGINHAGHTEMIAELTGCRRWRMSLFAGMLRVVHVSGHLSLRDAIEYLSVGRIHESVLIAHEALQRMGLIKPRIAVAGLNPHAGEAGAFGHEDLEIIAPAAALCRAEGIDCTGPVSPDTVFRQMSEGIFDIVVAMYHDQGHIPLKLVAMDEGVNVTLGLPIVRTSVDHGTAYDIAWQGKAREASLCAAIALASEMAAAGNADAA